MRFYDEFRRRKFSLRKNDQVQVIAGREKGKTGKILKVDSKTGRVTVEKMNMVKRHTRPTQGMQVELLKKNCLFIIRMCSCFAQSVIEAFATVTSWWRKLRGAKATTEKQGKVRVCKRCNESLDVA